MKTSTLSPYRWTILIIVCAICFMANFMQYQVSAWGVTVMDMLQTDVAGLTNLMLMPMLTAVFLSIPSGSLADKFGVKRVVSVALTISVAGGFLRSFTLGSVPAQTVAMFLIGFGIAALNANLAKILGTWFKEQTSLAMGFFYAASCVAIVIAQVFSTLMGTLFMSYLIAAFLMAATAVAWIVFARNAPAGEPLPDSEPIVQYLKIACKSKNVWFIALAYGLTLASTTAYCSILPSALELGRGVDTMLAGSLAAIITVGSFLACFAGPAAVLKLGKNKPFLIVTTFVGAAVMFVSWFVPLGPGLWTILVLNGFFTALSGPIIQAMTPEIKEIGIKYAGSAGGIIGTVGLLCSYLLPLAVSFIAGDNWMLNLSIESGLFLLSVVFIMALPETGIKGDYLKQESLEPHEA
ncbi:MFS transporter [Adlercreutzia equolifaciens]|uniref:MFS transporter n=1 Tax=Adlercreutzia equolifaciens TaxID=446660 RepID=UPI003AAE939C